MKSDDIIHGRAQSVPMWRKNSFCYRVQNFHGAFSACMQASASCAIAA
jgi:hypothetical protein